MQVLSFCWFQTPEILTKEHFFTSQYLQWNKQGCLMSLCLLLESHRRGVILPSLCRMWLAFIDLSERTRPSDFNESKKYFCYDDNFQKKEVVKCPHKYVRNVTRTVCMSPSSVDFVLNFLFSMCSSFLVLFLSLGGSMQTFNKVNFEIEITKWFSTVLQKRRKKRKSNMYREMTSHSCRKP